MSMKLVAWALDQTVPKSSEKFVLVAMCNFANESGFSFPAVSTVCHLTGLHSETVRGAIEHLVKYGLMSLTDYRAGTTGQIFCYQINAPAEFLKKDQGLPRLRKDFGKPESLKDPGKRSVKTRQRVGKDSGKPSTYSVTSNSEPSITTPAVPPGPQPEGPKPADPESDHRKLTRLWCEAFEADIGTKYAYTGRCAKAVKNLLDSCGVPVERIIEVARAAWKLSGYPFSSALNLSQLFQRWNEINGELIKRGKLKNGYHPAPAKAAAQPEVVMQDGVRMLRWPDDPPGLLRPDFAGKTQDEEWTWCARTESRLNNGTRLKCKQTI